MLFIVNYIHSYEIPGPRGSLTQDDPLFNMTWDCNYPANSQQFTNPLTDTSGVTHRLAIGVGQIRPEIVSTQRDSASSKISDFLLYKFPSI